MSTSLAPTAIIRDTEITTLLKDLSFREVPIKGGTATTGLYTPRVNKKITIGEIIEFLKSLHFENHPDKPNAWDCSERALWGVVHARRRYPGCAIGIAEGPAKYLANNPDHAVIIIWDIENGSYKYFEPLRSQTNPIVDFNDRPVRIIAFPFNVKENSDPVQLIGNFKMSRIFDKNFAKWDTEYRSYKWDGNDGIEKFLHDRLFDYPDKCPDLNAHQSDETYKKDYWKDQDKAFWSYMHVRQFYPGCAIGVAYGEQSIPNRSYWINVIWSRDKENGPIKTIYWDPSQELGEPNEHIVKQFKPLRLFF
jgi:hypothetical protein